MAKFGDLINDIKPVLFCFYSEDVKTNTNNLNDVVSIMDDKVKIIKINTDRNSAIASALNIAKGITYTLYVDSVMEWREEKELNSIMLMKSLKNYL